MLRCKTGTEGYFNYWATSMRATLREKYLHTRAAKLNSLEVKVAGSHRPPRGCGVEKDTLSREDHLSLLLLRSVIPLLFLILAWLSLRRSPPLPPDLFHKRNEEEGATEGDESHRHEEEIAKTTTVRNENVRARRETRTGVMGGGQEVEGRQVLSPPPPRSLSLRCSDVSGWCRGAEVSPAGFWPQQSDQGHRWEQGRLSCRVLHQK